MNWQERGKLYNESEFGIKYPSSRFMINDRWISATWVPGNNYKGSGYYGAYPPSYLDRVYTMFPDVYDILHLFSGSLTAEGVKHAQADVWRMDINPKCDPDIVGNCEDTGLEPSSVDMIMADPPYSIMDAKNYGHPLANRKKVFDECHRLLVPGGSLVWLDQSQPMHRKAEWKWVGIASIYRSGNHRVRGAFFYERL